METLVRAYLTLGDMVGGGEGKSLTSQLKISAHNYTT